jgi:signal transduction histidine kinase
VYEIRVTPRLLKGEAIGSVINFRNITKRKLAEDALHMINQKLLLLSGITRHDILNQLTALGLCLNLVTEENTDPGVHTYINKALQITKTIQLQTEFTRDYQDIGLTKPVWVNLADTFEKAACMFEEQNLAFSFHGQKVEIYTDPLLERVFYNLIDNSIRHGEHVTSIHLTTIPAGDGLVVRYEDNGCGVDPREKHRIFEKGYGNHTGLGMFLIHEILSITGITIEEKGMWGEGVRFDITVPAGKFRKL